MAPPTPMPTQALTHRISTSAPQLPGGTAKQSVVSATPIAPKPATAAPTKAKRYNSLKGLTGLLKSSNQPATPTPMPTTTTATPAPSSGLPPPTTITCGHCQRTGLHYTKDCPLSCDYCQARGHVEIDCTPECPCCLGQGEIKKMFRPEVPEDVRPAVRQFHAAVKGIREAWRRLNSDNEARECRGREEVAKRDERLRLQKELEESCKMILYHAEKSEKTLKALKELDAGDGGL